MTESDELFTQGLEALARGDTLSALAILERAGEPHNTVHYLNLGRIFLTAGKKDDAIRTFREELGYEQNREIIDELEKLGTRRPPGKKQSRK